VLCLDHGGLHYTGPFSDYGPPRRAEDRKAGAARTGPRAARAHRFAAIVTDGAAAAGHAFLRRTAGATTRLPSGTEHRGASGLTPATQRPHGLPAPSGVLRPRP